MSIGKKFPKQCDAPMPVYYMLELDTSTELDAKDSGHYESLMGVLLWIVETCRMDMCLEVPMMASCISLPRDGKLEITRRNFAHLKKHHNAEMLFDPAVPNVNNNDF